MDVATLVESRRGLGKVAIFPSRDLSEPKHSVKPERELPFLDSVRNHHASRYSDSAVKQKPDTRTRWQIGAVSRNEFVFAADSGGKLGPYVVKGVASAFTTPPNP